MGDASITLTLSGISSVLESQYFPPIELSPKKRYALGLVELLTFNSIPNIDSTCNGLKIGEKIVRLPTGSYEIADIGKYIQQNSKKTDFSLTANNNTLKSVIKCSEAIDFAVENSIAPLLGFSRITLEPNQSHTSSTPVRILKFNVIRVECNITTGAYINNNKVHTIHEFFPAVAPGFKIIEIPSKIIYQPIHVNSIENIQLKIVDEDGDLIDFRGETITIRLHIKSLK